MENVCKYLLVFVLVVGHGALGAAEGEGFTPEHVAKLRVVLSSKISPDGKSIAYTLAVPRKPFKKFLRLITNIKPLGHPP